MDPIPIKKDIIDILQRFFKQDPDFPYEDDQDKTRLTVADVHGVDRKNVEQYPAVFIERGIMQYGQVGIGDNAFSTWSTKKAPQPSDNFACLVTGSLICRCVSYEGAEAERIATKVASFLQMTKRELGTHLKIRIEKVAIGAEEPLKDWPPGLIGVPVSFGYTHGIMWKITDLDTIIRGSIATIKPV